MEEDGQNIGGIFDSEGLQSLRHNLKLTIDLFASAGNLDAHKKHDCSTRFAHYFSQVKVRQRETGNLIDFCRIKESN
jgi:hypothetical protein